jgi:vacuolar-type H+-ATPase subunit E/Vma4
MPLDNILQSIEQRKAEEAASITEKYRAQMETVEKEAERKIREIEQGAKRREYEDSRALENRELSNAEIEARKLIWEKRSALIEEHLTAAFESMKDIRSSSTYKKILSSMINAAHLRLGKDCKIIINPRDSKIVKGTNIVEKDIDPYGGIIAESADGTMEMDMTVTTLMKDLRERLSLAFYERIGAN